MNDDEDIGWSLDANGNETNLRLYSVGGDVNITVKGDAVVKGNIYAGGSWDTTATRTLGDTEIILSGGKVTGNIYGSGNRDIVVGNTHVTFLGNGTVLSEGSIVSGGGINGAEVLGTRYLHIGEVDIATTCSLNIMDFDEIIIAEGSEANLNSVAMTRSALTLDNITLLTTTEATEHTFTLNLNGISTEKLTIAIQFSDAVTELSDYSISLFSDTLDTSELTAEVILLDAQGNIISDDEVQFIDTAIAGGTLFTISSSVPEPTTATLSLLALAGLAMRRRRK